MVHTVWRYRCWQWVGADHPGGEWSHWVGVDRTQHWQEGQGNWSRNKGGLVSLFESSVPAQPRTNPWIVSAALRPCLREYNRLYINSSLWHITSCTHVCESLEWIVRQLSEIDWSTLDKIDPLIAWIDFWVLKSFLKSNSLSLLVCTRSSTDSVTYDFHLQRWWFHAAHQYQCVDSHKAAIGGLRQTVDSARTRESPQTLLHAIAGEEKVQWNWNNYYKRVDYSSSTIVGTV